MQTYLGSVGQQQRVEQAKSFSDTKACVTAIARESQGAVSYLSLRNELNKLFQPIQTTRDNEIFSLQEVDTSHHDNIFLSKDFKLYSTGSSATLNKANVPLCKTGLYTAQT